MSAVVVAGELLAFLDRPEVERAAPGVRASIERVRTLLVEREQSPDLVGALLDQAEHVAELERKIAREIARSAGLADEREMLEAEVRGFRDRRSSELRALDAEVAFLRKALAERDAVDAGAVGVEA